MRIAIMQGRLVPPEGATIQCFPRERWADEFALAAEAGLDAIEWIHDAYGETMNPLLSDEGARRMRELADASGVRVRSLCADWFMDRPLLDPDPAVHAERSAHLAWLLARCAAQEIERVVLPFVDHVAIRDEAQMDLLARTLAALEPDIEETGVEVHLETSLPPADFAALLERIPHPLVRVNYDSGNSAALGYDPREEFAAYGRRIGSFHLKDRRRGGGTVPLGEGDAPLGATFARLREAGYRGDLVLQVARGDRGDEVRWARANRETAERLIREAGGWS